MKNAERMVVTGGAGFIGSHLTDYLVAQGYEVAIVDNLTTGFAENINKYACFIECSILETKRLAEIFRNVAGVFHCAAIARTPWCLQDPMLAAQVNAQGTASVLEAARQAGVHRTVLSSSNVVYAAYTPYRATKEMGEMWGRVYRDCYQVNSCSLRYSNVYGPRQSELGPSPNVFAALRKCLREKGYMEITGDGTQSRDFTHVHDIVRAQLLAFLVDHQGEPIDLCTGHNYTMNQVATMFGGPVQYIAERAGDVKHIKQDPTYARSVLGWQARTKLENGIKDCL